MELKGIGVSTGTAVGPALLVEREDVPVFRLLLPAAALGAEVERLTRAVQASRAQLQAIKERLSREVGLPHAYIFEAHLLMLEDPLLLDRAVSVIREDRVNAEWALRTVSDQLHALFEDFTDAYLKERSSDLDDVLGRIHLNLRGAEDAPSLSRLPGRFVLVADDLTPSEAASLDWKRVLGVATDAGSATHHTSILARSYGIPAVVGLRDATRRIVPGALVVVDGARGLVVVEPTGPALAVFHAAQERERREEEQLQGTRGVPAVTPDGCAVSLQANAEFPEEAATAVLYGAQGIGLFRSEYLIGRKRDWPTEQRQCEVYAGLLDRMRPHPVTVRLWDLGAEDMAPGGPTSANPALGERSLRLLARHPGPFLAQMRALLRAAAHGPLRIMLPFVTGAPDLDAGLELLAEAARSLERDGLEHRADVPVGVQLEVPSAALTADLMGAGADFFSVGTNDLIQYLLAVDRADPRVSALYQSLHPAVLRVIASVVDAGARCSVPVSVCGEMASQPLHAVLLLGLGVRELSMSPAAIPRVKAAIRAVSATRAEGLARHCLTLRTAAEIEAALSREWGTLVAAAAAAADGSENP